MHLISFAYCRVVKTIFSQTAENFMYLHISTIFCLDLTYCIQYFFFILYFMYFTQIECNVRIPRSNQQDSRNLSNFYVAMLVQELPALLRKVLTLRRKSVDTPLVMNLEVLILLHPNVCPIQLHCLICMRSQSKDLFESFI